MCSRSPAAVHLDWSQFLNYAFSGFEELLLESGFERAWLQPRQLVSMQRGFSPEGILKTLIRPSFTRLVRHSGLKRQRRAAIPAQGKALGIETAKANEG